MSYRYFGSPKAALWMPTFLLSLFGSATIRAQVPQIPCPDGHWNAACHACNDGSDLSACSEVGEAFRGGDEHVPDNRPRAAQFFRSGCERGDPAACRHVAEMLVGAEAEPYYTRACEGGDGEGCRGAAFLQGGPAIPNGPQWQRALELYEEGCRLNDGASCSRLGYAYLRGEGLRANRDRARELFQRACELGYASACRSLDPSVPEIEARLHFFGEGGVAVDIGHGEGARFTFDVGVGYRQRLYRFRERGSALQLLPEIGYSYNHDLERGHSWLTFGLGLRWTDDEEHDHYAFAIIPAFVIATTSQPAMGLRSTLRFGLLFDSFYVDLSHEWQRAGDEDFHLFKATIHINILGLIIGQFV